MNATPEQNCKTEKSLTITIRLRADELAALDKLCQSPVTGDVSRTEKIRQLILLATAKNAHEPAPGVEAWQKEFRAGRPSAKNLNTMTA